LTWPKEVRFVSWRLLAPKLPEQTDAAICSVPFPLRCPLKRQMSDARSRQRRSLTSEPNAKRGQDWLPTDGSEWGAPGSAPPSTSPSEGGALRGVYVSPAASAGSGSQAHT